MSTMGPIDPWNAPVVEALDKVETMPGFSPEQVEWDNFRFSGTGFRKDMDRVFIFAYPMTPGLDEPVRFHATQEGFRVLSSRGREDIDLSVDEVARMLNVPADSARLAIAELKPALRASLAAYNVRTEDAANGHSADVMPARTIGEAGALESAPREAHERISVEQPGEQIANLSQRVDDLATRLDRYEKTLGTTRAALIAIASRVRSLRGGERKAATSTKLTTSDGLNRDKAHASVARPTPRGESSLGI